MAAGRRSGKNGAQLTLFDVAPNTLLPQAVTAAAPRARTGPAPARRAASAFSYTDAMYRLVISLVETLPDLSHIDPERLLVAATTAKVGGEYGTYAKIVPLRFQGGERRTRHRGRVYEMPVLRSEGRELLYLVYFFLPRFHELPYRDKLATVIHELYHISPAFDGDIRRFPGRNYAHGHSREAYQARMEQFADQYEALRPGCPYTEFLRLTWPELHAAHPKISVRRVPLPRATLVPGEPRPVRKTRS